MDFDRIKSESETEEDHDADKLNISNQDILRTKVGTEQSYSKYKAGQQNAEYADTDFKKKSGTLIIEFLKQLSIIYIL